MCFYSSLQVRVPSTMMTLLPEQTTPASSLCPQSGSPRAAGQAHRFSSVPVQFSSSRWTGPRPGGKEPPCPVALRAEPQPSWAHTTWASRRSHRSSHTVPHLPSLHSSTRPAQRSGPPASRAACWPEPERTRTREHCAVPPHPLGTVLQATVSVRAVVEAAGVGRGAGSLHTVDAAAAQVPAHLFNQHIWRVCRQSHRGTAPVPTHPQSPAAFNREAVDVRVT
ncbi:hypothetical protein EYF80_064883 [Liparis tanakae]|uniref:Uncharacterized protein n=1 Tax=Liparis tanakae TaxID=230148 RepID=A0A4Z2E897_9TELE|nr:hypothetical protein EYF80_064883 [Liparis tanakae]